MSDQTKPAARDVLTQLRRSGEIFELIGKYSGTEFQIQKQLRARFPVDLVRAAITLAELRRKARTKFSRATEMWFDRKGLEQATAEEVARHKATRFAGSVFDFCCGIGSDSIALAGHCDVTAVDKSQTACRFAIWNAEVYAADRRLRVINADIASVVGRHGLLHIDPDRRPAAGRRTLRVEDCEPGLDVLARMTDEFKGGAIKLSPASNFVGKFRDTEIELVSLAGECKEATVWFGELAGDAPFRATILPERESLAGNPLDALTSVEALGPYLFDPDPSVVRAGLVDLLAEETGLRRLDESEGQNDADSSN